MGKEKVGKGNIRCRDDWWRRSAYLFVDGGCGSVLARVAQVVWTWRSQSPLGARGEHARS